MAFAQCCDVSCRVHNAWHKISIHQITGKIHEMEIRRHKFQSWLSFSCLGHLTTLSFPRLICKWVWGLATSVLPTGVPPRQRWQSGCWCEYFTKPNRDGHSSTIRLLLPVTTLDVLRFWLSYINRAGPPLPLPWFRPLSPSPASLWPPSFRVSHSIHSLLCSHNDPSKTLISAFHLERSSCPPTISRMRSQLLSQLLSPSHWPWSISPAPFLLTEVLGSAQNLPA